MSASLDLILGVASLLEDARTEHERSVLRKALRDLLDGYDVSSDGESKDQAKRDANEQVASKSAKPSKSVKKRAIKRKKERSSANEYKIDVAVREGKVPGFDSLTKRARELCEKNAVRQNNAVYLVLASFKEDDETLRAVEIVKRINEMLGNIYSPGHLNVLVWRAFKEGYLQRVGRGKYKLATP